MTIGFFLHKSVKRDRSDKVPTVQTFSSSFKFSKAEGLGLIRRLGLVWSRVDNVFEEK